MTTGRIFLLEVGCEEIPAAALPQALADLRARLLEALGGPDSLGGESPDPPPLGGPRRLVVLITGVKDRQEDRVVTVTGPPAGAAFDREGRPTAAALGFARAQGVGVEELQRVRGEKGEVVAARKRVTGREAAEVLAAACPRILAGLRFPKTMRWGDRGFTFVRPVHWILALLDGEVVPFEFLGVSSGRTTLGHRFLSPGPHDVARAVDYEAILRERGRVEPRIEARRGRIVASRDRAAAAMGWRARHDAALLDELTHLTEWPDVVAGGFDERLLDLPPPVLVTVMKHHQKYFPAETLEGGLAAGFLAVINAAGDPDGLIRRGNEWVLRARLADARFFWDEDRKRRLQDRLPDLARVGFQERLGDCLQRSARLEGLCGHLAAAYGLGGDAAGRLALAARLAKADLTTGMVGEFPELQGIMGCIYAEAEGAPPEVARAIRQQYATAPSEAGEASLEGLLLALADKLDLLAGSFAVGLVPKGSADPYGLRRAALGVCRLLSDPGGLHRRLPLRPALEAGLALYVQQGLVASPGPGVPGAILDFVEGRLRFLMQESGLRYDTVRAVLAAGWSDHLPDALARAAQLDRLRGLKGGEAFDALATSAKRIRNILAQAGGKGAVPRESEVDASLLAEPEEAALHEAVIRARGAVESEAARGGYEAALGAIAALRPQVDRFFDKVLVMAPDASLRRNRLALLAGLSALLSRVADFSEIVVEGELAKEPA